MADLALVPITLLAAVLALVLGARRRRATQPGTDEADRILRSLAAEVRADWHKEAGHRGLDKDSAEPRLLHTQWTAVSRDLADPSAPSVVGSTADMAGLVEAFTALAPRRLVVIGPAGSGKSTLLLLLLLELCETRADRSPVPVIFSMSSYDPRRNDLIDWLADQLAAGYAVGSVTAARSLLEQGRVLPILDGLDEIPRGHRVAALDRIRGTFHQGLPVIVACRTEEYRLALRSGPVLTGAAVTEARELAFPHVLTYLRRSLERGPGYADWEGLFQRMAHGWGVLQDELADARASGTVLPLSWSVLADGAGLTGSVPAEPNALWKRWSALVRPETVGCAADALPLPLLVALGDALSSPLMATLFADLFRYAVSEDDDMFQRLATARPERVRETILDAAVHMMFHRPLPPSPWPEAERYLVFLARRLSATDRTDLAWWELSEAVPPAFFGVLLGLLMGLAGGVTTAFAVNGDNGALAGVELGLSGLVTGTVLSWLGPDRTASLLDRASPRNPRFSRLSTALAVGVPMTLVTGLQVGVTSGPVGGLLGGGIFGVVLGAVAGLLGAGGPVRGPRWFRRGSGFWRRVRGGAATGTLAGIPLGCLFWLVLMAATPPGAVNRARIDSPLYGVSAMLTGVLFGLVLGGLSGVLRWLQVPAPADDSVSPRSLLGGDRRLVLGWGLLVACLFAAPMVLVMHTSVVEGVVLIAGLALWVPIAVRTWPRYVVARCWLALRGRLPWRLMAFLGHAYDVSALRQVGGVYQFRHQDVQRHLSGRR
jgi:NACHT domain